MPGLTAASAFPGSGRDRRDPLPRLRVPRSGSAQWAQSSLHALLMIEGVEEAGTERLSRTDFSRATARCGSIGAAQIQPRRRAAPMKRVACAGLAVTAVLCGV